MSENQYAIIKNPAYAGSDQYRGQILETHDTCSAAALRYRDLQEEAGYTLGRYPCLDIAIIRMTARAGGVAIGHLAPSQLPVPEGTP